MNILSWKLQHLQKNFKRHNLQCYLIWIKVGVPFFCNFFYLWVFHYKHIGTMSKRSNYIHKMLLNTRGTASIVFLAINYLGISAPALRERENSGTQGMVWSKWLARIPERLVKISSHTTLKCSISYIYYIVALVQTKFLVPERSGFSRLGPLLWRRITIFDGRFGPAVFSKMWAKTCQRQRTQRK